MHQAIRTAIVTVAIVASYALPYAANAYLSYPREFKDGIERDAKVGASHNISSIAPVALSAHAIQRHATILQIGLDPNFGAPAATGSPPSRLQAKVDRISFGSPSLAPMAFVRFCMRYSRECRVHRMAFRPSPVALTNVRRAELAKVNRDVNRAIRPQENLNGVMAEEWLVAPREGDCNDYAVTKRHKLLVLGWPSRSLLLTEVVVPTGEHHLVLVVRTRGEDLVLDNLNWNVRPISQVSYRWVRAQQPRNPRFWSMISVKSATPMAMNAR